mgnify:FL=1
MPSPGLVLSWNQSLAIAQAVCARTNALTMIHNVFFWLKPDLSAEQLTTFETELMHLLEIEYLVHAFVGKPAATEKRPVTDHSFSYSLTLHFKDLKDHEFYQKECPKHLRFVAACKTFWERVVIYDSSPLH